jgi:hypothetical protein
MHKDLLNMRSFSHPAGRQPAPASVDSKTGANEALQRRPWRSEQIFRAGVLSNALAGAGFALIGAGFESPAAIETATARKEPAP